MIAAAFSGLDSSAIMCSPTTALGLLSEDHAPAAAELGSAAVLARPRAVSLGLCRVAPFIGR